MRKILALAVLLAVMLPVSAFAEDACLYGSATWRSGSKIDGSTRVSTSWNGREAYPKNGQYRLCLGSNPKQRITVYVDGQKYAEIYVDGNTRLNIVRD